MLGAQFHLRDDTEVVCLQGFAPGVQRYPPWPWYQLGSLTRSLPEVLLQKVALPNLSSAAQAGLALMWWIRSRNWSGSEQSCQKGRGKGLFSASWFPRQVALVQGNHWKQSLLPELLLIYTRFNQAGKWGASHRSLVMPRRSISHPAYPPSLCPCCSHSWCSLLPALPER